MLKDREIDIILLEEFVFYKGRNIKGGEYMRTLVAISLVFIVLFLSSCSNNNSSIDMKDIMDKSKNYEKKSENADKARKSIFPNLKDK